MTISFKVHHKDQGSNGRVGKIATAHGEIRTPTFMPVGTCASVKAMKPEDVADTGADIILSNTYHLMLRPGEDLVEKMGGLRNFMNWKGPILTDSGGFQVMSLSKICKIKEDGAHFQSHIDGKKHLLTPERSMLIQHKLGSTITMILDECIPYPSTKDRALQAMELSLRWAKRCKESYQERKGYALFAINQGGMYDDLREKSAKELVDMDFDGYAIGGLAVGEPQDIMLKTIQTTEVHLPKDKPRYLMGVGKPDDIIESVKRGIDMFDCVIPTRSGRNNQVFTRQGALNLKNSQYAEDKSPIDPKCQCCTCQNYSRSYLHHLIKAREILAPMLLTQHNLHYYQDLMRAIRKSIQLNQLNSLTIALDI